MTYDSKTGKCRECEEYLGYQNTDINLKSIFNCPKCGEQL